jgi:hypothetical protein
MVIGICVWYIQTYTISKQSSHQLSVRRLATGWKVQKSIPVGALFHTGLGAQPASCKIEPDLNSGGKAVEPGIDQPPLSSADVNKIIQQA